MDSMELVRLVRQDAHPLVEGLYGELRTNLGTSHYHRLSNEELFRRGHAVYEHLAGWLAERKASDIHAYGEELGRKRFSEGIPLGQVVLALILEEKHLWDYLNQTGHEPAPDALRLQVSEYFARAIYSTALGYEASLAQSNRRAGQSVVLPTLPGDKPHKPAPSEAEGEMTISRGGEVGEHGG
jgi:hypothetical protein